MAALRGAVYSSALFYRQLATKVVALSWHLTSHTGSLCGNEDEYEMNQYLLVAGLLGELTAELQRLERWQAEHPADDALASTLPFCVDTLSFDQWLQFVLIPRMEQLVMLQAPLPTSVSLYPMASEVYKNDLVEAEALLRLIARFDLLLSGKVAEQ